MLRATVFKVARRGRTRTIRATTVTEKRIPDEELKLIEVALRGHPGGVTMGQRLPATPGSIYRFGSCNTA